MSNSQAGVTANFPAAMDEAARHMGYVIKKCVDEHITTIESTQEQKTTGWMK